MKQFLALLSCVILLGACEKEASSERCYIDPAKYDLVIKTGTMCGWCGGQDSMIITYERTNYGWDDPCGDKDIFKSEKTDSTAFLHLLQLLDFETFKSIEVNSCNVCADGCDDWIQIKLNGQSHYIRYGYADTAIVDPIKPFIQKLEEIKSAYTSHPGN